VSLPYIEVTFQRGNESLARSRARPREDERTVEETRYARLRWLENQAYHHGASQNPCYRETWTATGLGVLESNPEPAGPRGPGPTPRRFLVLSAGWHGESAILVDLRELEFIDSMGIRALMQAYTAGQDGHSTVSFIRAEGHVPKEGWRSIGLRER